MHATLNGIDIAYTDEGEGSALLFVHGFPLSRRTWSKQVEAFKPTHRVLAPDLRGLGETEATEGAVSMARFAEDLSALLQHLQLGPVTLVGHSMGGYVALAFAAAHPQALQGLVLVGTKSGADTPEAAAGRRALAARVQKEGAAIVVDAMAPKMLAESNRNAAMAAEVRGFMLPSKPMGVIGALLGMAERPDMEASLGQLRVPALVVTGAEDSIIPPSESEAMARAIPGAQLDLLADGGHLVAFERADAFNATLRGWLAAHGLK
jgi:pimeloyl-ACP methyl ester carboxylesterase